MTRTCFGLAITTCLTCGAITAATEAALPVASTTTTSSFESFFAKASRRGRRISTRPSRLSLPSSQATASAKARWISRPMIRMFAGSVSVRSKRKLAGDTTSTDPRSRRIRESRKGRPCTGSQPTVYRRPARTFVLPAPRVPDGLTISPSPFREQPDNEAPTDHIPDNGKIERFWRSLEDDLIDGATFDNLDHFANELFQYLIYYNELRPDQALAGLTPKA